MNPSPPVRTDDLYHRAALFALACAGVVKPATYVRSLAAEVGQGQAVIPVDVDKGSGPFIWCGLSYDPAAANGLSAAALVQLETDGRELCEDGGVTLDQLANSTAAATRNVWEAAPAILKDGGQAIIRIRYDGANVVQAGESLTLFGFHTDAATLERFRRCWAAGPWWLRRVLTSTASDKRPTADRALRDTVQLYRYSIDGESDALEIVAGSHRVLRGDERTTEDQTPNAPGALGESLWPLVVPRGELLGTRKRDATARTTVVTYHGALLAA